MIAAALASLTPLIALGAFLYASPGVAFAEDSGETISDGALVEDEVAMRVAAPCIELLAAERMGDWRATPEAHRFTALVAIIIHGHVMAVDEAQLTAAGRSERFELYDERVVQCYRLVHQSESLADFNTRLWNWDISG